MTAAVIALELRPVRTALAADGWFHIGTAAILGFGVGSGVSHLWAAKKIGEFEREDGRHVLKADVWSMEGLYAG